MSRIGGRPLSKSEGGGGPPLPISSLNMSRGISCGGRSPLQSGGGGPPGPGFCSCPIPAFSISLFIGKGSPRG